MLGVSHCVTMGISGVPYNKAAGKRALSTGDAVIHDPYVGHEDISSHTDTSKISMGIPFEDESDDCRIIGDVYIYIYQLYIMLEDIILDDCQQ